MAIIGNIPYFQTNPSHRISACGKHDSRWFHHSRKINEAGPVHTGHIRSRPSLARPKGCWHNLQYPGPDWIVQLGQFSWCPMMSRNFGTMYSQHLPTFFPILQQGNGGQHVLFKWWSHVYLLFDSFPKSSRPLYRMSFFLNRNMSYLRCLFWETPSIVPVFLW